MIIPSLTVDPPIDRTEPTVLQWKTTVDSTLHLGDILDAAKTLRLELVQVGYSNSPVGEYVVTFEITIPGIAHPRDGEI